MASIGDPILERLVRVEILLEKMVKLIEGNGRPGLAEEFDTVKALLTEHMAQHKRDDVAGQLIITEAKMNTHLSNGALHRDPGAEKERKEFWGKIQLAVVGMIVTNIGIIVTAAVLVALGLK
jgi:hypothetical protein